MKVIRFNKKQYYIVDDVKEEYSFLFKHCNRARNIVKERKIRCEDHCFVVLRNNKWELDKASNPHARLFLTKQYVDNVIKYGDRPCTKIKSKNKDDSSDDSDDEVHKNPKDKLKNTSNKQKNNTDDDSDSDSDNDDQTKFKNKSEINKRRQVKKVINTINYTNKKEVEYTKSVKGTERKYYKMPPILELKNSEKFKDNHDDIIEIQVRGSRDKDLCFFRLLDISKGLGMPNLRDTVLQDGSGYVIKMDYIFFAIPVEKRNRPQGDDLYLTYNGLVRMLYVSNSTTARKFQDWASRSLFTLQMGTLESKQQLFSEVMGIPVDALKYVYNPMSIRISCIYFFFVAYVKDVRESMSISDKYNDDDILGKLGQTVDVVQRGYEHKIKTFKNIKGVNLHLKYCVMIDPGYLTEGENMAKSELKEYSFRYKSMTELVIIQQNKLHDISCVYNEIGNKYGARVKELNQIIREKDRIHENELLKKDIKYMALEKTILDNENIALKKTVKKLRPTENSDSDND